MTVNVLSGLKKKRDELSKQLLNHRTEMHKTIAALDSIDSTIRLYDPTFKPESDYNRQPGKINRWFRKGEKPALILDSSGRAQTTFCPPLRSSTTYPISRG